MVVSLGVGIETLKTKFKLARLREELNWLAISEEIDQTNKGYAHLYNSIDKVLAVLPRFNFWMVL